MDVTQEFDKVVSKRDAHKAVWRRLAEENDWRCEICGSLIELEDETTYYLTDMCGPCDHRKGKFDRED